MAENEDKLYRLIHSLDKSEKGFVKKFASLHVREDANGVRLFDIYNKVIPYDESKLDKLLSKEKFYGHLPKVKNYLYELTLKALRNYYVEKDEYYRLNTIIQNATILKNKRLHKESLSAIKKVKKECLEQERWLLLSEANGIERQLQPSFYTSPEEYFDGFTKWKEEDDLHKELYYGGRFFTELYYKVFYLIHLLDKQPKNELGDQIEKISSTSQYKTYSALNSIRIKTLHLKIKLYENFMKNDHEAFHKNATTLLQFYGKENITHIYLPHTVIGLINNLALIAIIYSNEKIFNDSLDLLKQTQLNLLDKNEGAVVVADNCISYLNSYYFMSKGWFDKGIDLCKKKLATNENTDDGLTENKATLYYYQSAFLFLSGKFSEAIKSLNAIDLYTEKHTSTGLESESQLIKILAHIELNNFESADYLAKKYVTFLEKRTPNFKQRIALMKVFKELQQLSKEALANDYFK